MPDAATGVAKSTPINDLTSADITTECKYLTYQWPQKKVDCGDGSTATIGYASVGACMTSLGQVAGSHPNCQATVDDIEMCLSLEYAEITTDSCTGDEPVSCARLASQDCGGTGS